ncbi:MAG: hypothetical protein K1Y36_16375 [Blastocatellia bacterium]|nr:hypothetical protein [Blastocatellia bacterium]
MIRTVLVWLVWSVWGSGLAAQTPAPPVPPADIADVASPFFRVYSDKDGLPQNTLQTMTLDKKGYLWVGTLDGAAYYNGRNWTKVTMPEGAASNIVNFIKRLRNGDLWFATDGGGLHRLNQETGGWTTFDAGGRQYGTFTAMTELASEGPVPQIVCATRRGYVLRGSPDDLKLLNVPLNDEDFVATALETTAPNGEKTLWLGSRKGKVFRLRAGAWNIFVIQPAKPDGEGVQQLLPQLGKPGASPWIVAFHSLWLLIEDTIQKFGGPAELEAAGVTSVLEMPTPQGDVIQWLGTDSGLFQSYRGKWRHFTTRSGLPHNFVYTILETNQTAATGQTLWIGTLGGLARLESGKWCSINTASGIDNHFVLSLCETRNPAGDPVEWIGTYGGDTGGVWKYEQGRWENFSRRSGLPNNVVWTILETTAATGIRTMWFGTNGGLSSLCNGVWRHYSQKDGLPTNSILSLAETKSATGDSILWISTFNGLVKLEQGQFTVFKTEQGLVSNATQSVLATKDATGNDVLWVGTINGLSRFESGQWTNFTRDNGLVHNQVLSMRETTSGTGRRFLWVGTRGGASRLDLQAGTWRNFTETTEVALPNNTVYQIRQDARHHIYLSTNKGIIRLAPLDEAGDRFEVFRFGLEDGLPSNECNRGASLVDSQGRIWFGTIAGAAIFDPRSEITDRASKPLYVENAVVVGREGRLTPLASLSYQQNHVSFEYALLSYFRETETEYQTQLAGLDPAPSAWSSVSKKEYLNLGEGDYIFRVWGRDYAGNITGPVDFAFSVRPAPWRTWWAYGLYILGLGVGVYGYSQHRLRLLKQHNLELEAKVTERTAQVVAQKNELEQANLKLRELDQIKANFTAMLVHDLKSPLSVVKASLELFETDEAIHQSDLAPLVGASSRSVDKILHLIAEVLEVFRSENQEMSIRPSLLDTSSLLTECATEARLAAQRQQISVSVELEPNLPALNGDREKLERALSNLLSNAIKFTPAGGSITLEARTLEGTGVERGLNWLRITITDTGEGIPPEELPYLFDPYRQANSNKARMGVGLGLAIVKRIVAAHGGNVSVRSQVGVGTSFTMILPLVTSSDKIERLEVNV